MATHRNSRSPLVINIARLGRRPGSMMTFNETVPAPARIGLELAAIPEGAPLQLDLRIESVSEGALVTGTMSAPTTGECARCLTPVTGHVEIDLTELFAYPASATEATTDGEARPPAREERSALGEALLNAGHRRQVTGDRAALVKALGIELPDELLTMALTHRSYSYETGALPTNERLEFLGDAVLGLTITEEL